MQAKEVSLVRVNVTGQPYDYFRPWQKKAPFSKRALGAVLAHDRVLVTADLVANQNYVELERAESGERTAANVVVVDYEANLACSSRAIRNFSKVCSRSISPSIPSSATPRAWQLEATGTLVVTEGIVTTIGMTRYPADVGDFLTYRMSIPMQYRDNSYTVPLVKNNKLAALLLRFDPRSQTLDAIPGADHRAFPEGRERPQIPGFSVVRHFLFPDARSGVARLCR